MTNPTPATAATASETAAAPATPTDPNAVELDEPIKRGSTEIKSVVLMRPNAGALRGTTLVALANMDVTALQTVIPRVTNPSISSAEVALMDPADLAAIGTKVAGFLLTKQDRAAFPGL
ncbi:hypothetical protein AKI39_03140 [Bordetella sp. H567]|uniref:phage tail assembly protein n=1 Tax=Bordetella sp. H567 TaxID=1697043 RepID=UPI00081CCECD|nr:phage tail assembly protein [Bordetella sp. H567]AOB29900.1 hypothetical protein AKI39_03140 [Bordetella sp. H567]